MYGNETIDALTGSPGLCKVAPSTYNENTTDQGPPGNTTERSDYNQQTSNSFVSILKMPQTTRALKIHLTFLTDIRKTED